MRPRPRHLRATLFSLLGLAATVGAAASASACGGSAAAAGTAAARRPDALPDDHGLRGPLLWEVQGPTATSYLFGTLHLGFRADRELPRWVWDKLGACDTFVMEADIGAVDVVQVAQLASLPDGQSLSDMLPAESWKQLVEMTGVAESSLRTRQPWFAAELLFERLYPTPVPLDLALMQRAS